MTTRRKLLGRATAAIAGVVGLSFGTGAFTETTASRDFSISLAEDDASSQLVVEPNDDLGSDAVEIDEGEFRIDTSGLSPSSTTTLGEFGSIDIDSPDTLEEPLFVIRNENETGQDVTIEAALSADFPDGDDDSQIGVFLVGPDDSGEDITNEQVIEAGETAPGAAEVTGVPSSVDGETSEDEAQVECGLIVKSDGSGTITGPGGDGGLEITAISTGGES